MTLVATLVTSFLNFAILLIFLRFLIQLADLGNGNPVVTVMRKIMAPLDSLNRLLPVIAKGKVHVAALISLVLLYLVKFFVLSQVFAVMHIYTAEHLLIQTFVTMIQNLISFCRYLVFAAIIVSWVQLLAQKHSPIMDFIQELAEPLFAPFRRILPNMGMIDLSPLLTILALIVVERVMDEVAITLLAGF